MGDPRKRRAAVESLEYFMESNFPEYNHFIHDASLRPSKYMKDVLVHKSYEEADNIDETIKKIILIKNDYENYLEAARKNSNILFKIFNEDPLKKNIV